MQLVEQHVISKHDPRYGVIDGAAFASKNLYNAANYEMRQAFIHQGIYLSYEEMDKRMQPHEAYQALPAKVSQQVLRQLAAAWKAFREAKAAYEEDPSEFTGRPKLPKYKHKTEGRNMLVYTMQALSKPGLRDGLIRPSGLPITIGKNPLWKQEVNNGRRNNQNFVAIPHARFIGMLTYKASLVGIQVEMQEESYTSKASFVDLDPIPTYKPNDDTEYIFSGKRIGRRNRLYRTKDGRKICADVNGSYNILRKSKPDAFAHVDAKGIAAYVVQPARLAITV